MPMYIAGPGKSTVFVHFCTPKHIKHDAKGCYQFVASCLQTDGNRIPKCYPFTI